MHVVTNGYIHIIYTSTLCFIVVKTHTYLKTENNICSQHFTLAIMQINLSYNATLQ